MKSILQAAAELEKAGKPGVLCTILHTSGSTPRHQGTKMLVYQDGSFIGTVGGGEIEIRVKAEALQAINDGKARRLSYNMIDPQKGDPGICGGMVEVYIDPILPAPKLIVIGGGHVGKAVVHLAKWLGFKVIVSDDRAEFCTSETNPEADEFHCGNMGSLPDQIEIDQHTYLVLTTRGSDVDIAGLGPLLNTHAAYIGLIGSKRRWIMTQKGLLDQGISQEKINRIHSPIGLEIQAETPEEIAISIMAEIIKVRNSNTGIDKGS